MPCVADDYRLGSQTVMKDGGRGGACGNGTAGMYRGWPTWCKGRMHVSQFSDDA